jgi:peptide/nickel transport system ATP-binding protein
MYAGQVQEEGDVDDVLGSPRHPYTQALIRSIPDPDSSEDNLSFIRGEPPNLIKPPPGCRFAPRCEYAFARCHSEMPALREIDGGRKVRCHLVVEGAAS